MSKLVLASLCFSLFTSLALAKELFFATGPDGVLFRVFSSGISACLKQNQRAPPLFGRISKDLKYKTPVSNHLQQQQISIKEWISTKCAGGPVN